MVLESFSKENKLQSAICDVIIRRRLLGLHCIDNGKTQDCALSHFQVLSAKSVLSQRLSFLGGAPMVLLYCTQLSCPINVNMIIYLFCDIYFGAAQTQLPYIWINGTLLDCRNDTIMLKSQLFLPVQSRECVGFFLGISQSD